MYELKSHFYLLAVHQKYSNKILCLEINHSQRRKSFLRHQCATLLACDGAVWLLLLLSSRLAASKMDKKLETDNLEMRIEALESRIYGDRGRRSGKTVKVRPECRLKFCEQLC